MLFVHENIVNIITSTCFVAYSHITICKIEKQIKNKNYIDKNTEKKLNIKKKNIGKVFIGSGVLLLVICIMFKIFTTNDFRKID